MLEMILSDYRFLAQDIFAFVVCFAALLWGGGPERIVAATWLIVFEFGGRVQDWIFGKSIQLADVDWFLAISDLLVAAVFLAVALFANRQYTLAIAGLQLIAITAHFARAVAEAISPVAYATMIIVPGWFQLIFLAIGLYRHILRKRRYGSYRDWRQAETKPGFAKSG